MATLSWPMTAARDLARCVPHGIAGRGRDPPFDPKRTLRIDQMWRANPKAYSNGDSSVSSLLASRSISEDTASNGLLP